MLSLEGVLQIVCVCSYGCELCGVTGKRKKKSEKHKMQKKKAAIEFDQPEHSGSTWLE